MLCNLAPFPTGTTSYMLHPIRPRASDHSSNIIHITHEFRGERDEEAPGDDHVSTCDIRSAGSGTTLVTSVTDSLEMPAGTAELPPSFPLPVLPKSRANPRNRPLPSRHPRRGKCDDRAYLAGGGLPRSSVVNGDSVAGLLKADTNRAGCSSAV